MYTTSLVWTLIFKFPKITLKFITTYLVAIVNSEGKRCTTAAGGNKRTIRTLAGTWWNMVVCGTMKRRRQSSKNITRRHLSIKCASQALLLLLFWFLGKIEGYSENGAAAALSGWGVCTVLRCKEKVNEWHSIKCTKIRDCARDSIFQSLCPSLRWICEDPQSE